MKRLLLLLLLAGCATSRVRPDIHREGWLLVETKHIALRTDLDRSDAIAHARQLEQSWGALAHLYGLVAPGAPPPRQQFPVIHLEDCSDFDRILTGAAGFVFNAVAGGDTAVTCEGRGGTTLVHELAHIFNHHHFVRVPIWVDEGLATYYSTLQVRDGRAVLGNFPSNLSTFWNRPRFLPNLSALRRMSRDEFYDPRGKPRNYFSAWKLVHLLNNTTADRRLRFRRYLAALRAGTSNDEAWQAAFGDLSSDDLAQDYVNYQKRERVNRLTTTFAWSEPPPPRVRPLRAGEAHLLWAELLAVAHPDAIAEQLERAARADPDWPGLLHFRVAARMREAIPPGYQGLGGAPPRALIGMEVDVRRLIEQSSDPAALSTIGWYYAMRQKPAIGLNFALRAVQAEPSCGRCWDAVGLLYFQAGKIDQAIDAQERAISIYAERVPADALARMRRYRRARAGSGS